VPTWPSLPRALPRLSLLILPRLSYYADAANTPQCGPMLGRADLMPGIRILL